MSGLLSSGWKSGKPVRVMSAVVRWPVPGAVEAHSSPPIVLLAPSSSRYDVIDLRFTLPRSQSNVAANTSEFDVAPTTPWRFTASVVSRPVLNGP